MREQRSEIRGRMSENRGRKTALLLTLCMAVALSVQAVEFETIRKNKESMTDLQWKQFQAQCIGQMVYWAGWVDEVKESGGRYKVLIDMDAPDALSVFDVTVYVSEQQAMSLRKDQLVSVQGRIKSIGTFLGFNILIENAVVRAE
jgi:hypothetical protein